MKKYPIVRFSGVVLSCLMLASSTVLLNGCSGGNGGLNVPSQNTYFGSSIQTELLGEAGSFQMQALAGNAVKGTLILGENHDLATPSFYLPDGTYTFSGTREGAHFTAGGHFNGTPSFDFTISGQSPTATNSGTWSLTASLNGQTFTYPNGLTAPIILPTALNGEMAFTFSQNSSNIVLYPMTGAVNADGSNQIAVSIEGTFSQILDQSTGRELYIQMSKESALAVGDTFSLTAVTPGTLPASGAGFILYRDTHEHLKTWIAESGTITVTAITPTNLPHIHRITVKVTNALLKPGFYTPSQGTGTFILNGTGTFGIQFSELSH